MPAGHAMGGDRRRAFRATDGFARAVPASEGTGQRRRADDRAQTGLEGRASLASARGAEPRLPAVTMGPRVARGATSVIHRGRHESLGSDVAMKVLDERFADDAGVRARLERE